MIKLPLTDVVSSVASISWVLSSPPGSPVYTFVDRSTLHLYIDWYRYSTPSTCLLSWYVASYGMKCADRSCICSCSRSSHHTLCYRSSLRFWMMLWVCHHSLYSWLRLQSPMVRFLAPIHVMSHWYSNAGMTLTFFYQVQDTGSWLEIGQSITFFCIASLLLLWSAGISAAGEYLMGDILTPRILIRKKHD